METADPVPTLSVIIPCYNEEENLKRGVLHEVHRYLMEQAYSWEVIVANDESTDRSRELVRQFVQDKEGFSLVDVPHGGKPAAIWGGIQKARGQVFLLTDMDQSTPIHELDKLLMWSEEGFDVVIGSRGLMREGFSSLRKLGSVVFRTMRSLFLLRDITDTQCGFKLCRREVALAVFPRLQFLGEERPAGWKVSAYDIEFLYLCERSGYRIKEVPVEWLNRDESDTKGQESEWARYFGESVDMAKEVVRVNMNRLRGLYRDIGKG